MYCFGRCSIGVQIVSSIDDFFQHLLGLILGYKYHLVSVTVESIILSHTLPEARKLKQIKHIYATLFLLIFACLLLTVIWEIFSEYTRPMPGYFDFVVVFGSVIMALLLASYIISFVRLGRAFHHMTDKRSNFTLNTVCFGLLFVIILTQPVYLIRCS